MEKSQHCNLPVFILTCYTLLILGMGWCIGWTMHQQHARSQWYVDMLKTVDVPMCTGATLPR